MTNLPAIQLPNGAGSLTLNAEAMAAMLKTAGYAVTPPAAATTPPPATTTPPPSTGAVVNPPPTTKGLTIQSDADVDLGWKESFASFWCDHKANFRYRRLIIDGRLIKPNPKQIEPKVFGASKFVFDGLVVRNIASCKNGDAGNASGDDVHTEGLYLGAAFDGEIRNSYWGFTDGNTAVAVFGTAFPGSAKSARIVLHNIRVDLGGVNGDGKTYWGGPIYFSFQGAILECVVRNAQIRRGASGGAAAFGNQSGAWPGGAAWGGSGYWEYAGSRTGGNSGKGFQWVEPGEPWPDFPDGDQTLPRELCVRGY